MGPQTLSVVLRDYQQQGVAGIRSAFMARRRVLFVLPTGGGKTITFSFIAASAAAKGNRIVIVAHRAEICRQISRALTAMGVPHGLIMPKAKATDDLVQVAMVQTLARRLDKVTEPALLVIDECHHAVTGSYRAVTDRWSKCKVLGVSATPERLDGRGLAEAFDDMVIGPTMRWLIQNGYLAAYDYFAPPSAADLSGVRSRAGDFAVDELATAMDKPTITGDAIQHYRHILAGRPAIAFCVTIQHAENVAQAFREAGFAAASIDGSMSTEERDELIQSLADGRLNVLTSCDLISEGVDVPVVAGAILLRPTKSLALFLQQVGRALRPKPDGSRAVILDHVGNVSRFGMPDADRAWSLESRPKRGMAEQEVLTCRQCGRAAPARGPAEVCDGAGGEPCPLQQEREAIAKTPPPVVTGKLTRVTDPFAWAEGIVLATASGRDWHRLMELAGVDEDRLRQIAKARGFKRGWVKHRVRGRLEVMARATAILHGCGTAEDIAIATRRGTDEVLWTVIRTVENAEREGNLPPNWLAIRKMARETLSQRRRAVA